jgi:glycerate kinase
MKVMKLLAEAFGLSKKEIEFILKIPESCSVGGLPAALITTFRPGNVKVTSSVDFFSKIVKLKEKVDDADIIISGVDKLLP